MKELLNSLYKNKTITIDRSIAGDFMFEYMADKRFDNWKLDCTYPNERQIIYTKDTK